jgi:SAM-dependent methyltransferase
VAVPTGLAWLVFLRTRDREGDDDGNYRNFWRRVGQDFPDLAGARSTDFYFHNEVRLLADHLPTLRGCRLLKTDLWDEAKNTRILCWAAEQGALVYGIDISEPIVRQARATFGGTPARFNLADVRSLPFADDSFDAIYSMGTIEHFDESEAAVREMARVLKPDGRLVLGVPNRHDPFLRPLLVWLLSTLGLYAYGFEKSYAGTCGTRSGRQHRHSLHPWLAAYGRPGLSCVVPAADTTDRTSRRLIPVVGRSSVVPPPSRILAGDGRTRRALSRSSAPCFRTPSPS